MIYLMPQPVVENAPDGSGPMTRLAESPPSRFLTVARRLADALPDTELCITCGLRVGHIAEAITGLPPVPDWETPYLTDWGAGSYVTVLCGDCAAVARSDLGYARLVQIQAEAMAAHDHLTRYAAEHDREGESC